MRKNANRNKNGKKVGKVEKVKKKENSHTYIERNSRILQPKKENLLSPYFLLLVLLLLLRYATAASATFT